MRTKVEKGKRVTRAAKGIVLFSIICMLGALTTGCGADDVSAGTETAAIQTDERLPKELNAAPLENDAEKAKEDNTVRKANETETAENAGNAAGAENSQENTGGGKWHVLEPEVAAAVDADFLGEVWIIAEGAFAIVEVKTMLWEDGSIVSSAPSSNAEIPDSELVHVIVDEDTYFYMRIIYNGKSYEDKEAGFGDLQEGMNVEMRGAFVNDVFYAAEVRMIKIA